MNALVLILAVVIPFPLCLFRMKKYGISLKKMLLIYVVVSVVGAIGACIGAVISNESMLSKRLYGLMLFDTALLFVLSPLLKVRLDDLGDFVMVPIMAVCFSSKIDCLVKGCCYGVTLWSSSQRGEVRFPSAIFEMLIWGIMTLLLLAIERSQMAKGALWPIGMIWFGIARFAVDFLRGSAWEKRIFVLGLTGGQFWSLVVLLIGAIYLYILLMHRFERKPRIKEWLYAVIGIVSE